MSLSFLSSLNDPRLVQSAGALLALGLPFATAAVTDVSATALRAMNIVSYGASVGAVSIPGRFDGEGDENNSDEKDSSNSKNQQPRTVQQMLSDRTLIAPAPWAFAIWGPIFLGEAVLCVAQFFTTPAATKLLPALSPPYIAANLFQCLWCASFRPKYFNKEQPRRNKFISAAMLAGTAWSLSLVHSSYVNSDALSYWSMIPVTLHFGWTTAATLVNLNGSIAKMESIEDSVVAAVGHASAVLATVIGVGVTLAQSSPIFGLTLAWALAGCSSGMTRRLAESSMEETVKNKIGVESLNKGRKLQKTLCMVGSVCCAAAAAASYFMVLSSRDTVVVKVEY